MERLPRYLRRLLTEPMALQGVSFGDDRITAGLHHPHPDADLGHAHARADCDAHAHTDGDPHTDAHPAVSLDDPPADGRGARVAV